MGIIIAILIFGLIVIFHEFGHFLLARMNGIRVNEFSIGMGPKLCGFKRGETEFAIRLLPFGGACMMAGEDEDVTDGERLIQNRSGQESLLYWQARYLILFWHFSLPYLYSGVQELRQQS